MKYIVVSTSGKQKIITATKYINIALSSIINIEDYICFNKVLLISKQNKLLFGKPYIKDCYILAKIKTKYKSKKLLILRNKIKKNYLKRKGYREILYRLYIEN